MSPADGATTEVRSDTFLRLVARPSGWRRIRLFGASARAPHTRRRADLITLLCVGIALAAVVPAAATTDGVELALHEALRELPHLIDPLFALAYDALAVWALAAVVLTALRRHWRLVLSLITAIPVGVALTLLVDAGLGLEDGADALSLGAPVVGVPLQLALGLAVTSIVSRELSRPFRTTSRRLMLAATAAAFLLPVSAPFRVVCAVLVAMATASAIRYVLGSPITSVSAGDVRDALSDLGIDAEPAEAWAEGVHEAVTPDGTVLGIRILGRDEWDTQLAVVLWRFLWYRNSGGRLLLGPRQQIEHHAFLLLLAQARGVPVTPVAGAGTSRSGDALLAVEIEGRALRDLDPGSIDDAFLSRCWGALAALHDAGIAHGSIDAHALRRNPDGEAVIGAFGRAQPLRDPDQVHADRAQLLVATALVAGPARAVAAAVRAVGVEGAAAATPLVSYLQAAALDEDLRREVARADLSLEELRLAMAAAAAIEVPDLQKIWRVSWGALIRLGLLAFVGYLLISQLADIGWDTIAEAITSADPWLLLTALVFGQIPRVASAASLQTASPSPVPLERVTRLQFATSFVNLAVPSTAARVAVSIRFFQRSGATPGGAVSAGALDSVAGFVAQISLLGGFLLLGAGTLGSGGFPDGELNGPDIVRLLVFLAAAVGAVALLVTIIPKLRQQAVKLAGQLKEALAMLRSPALVARLIALNVLAELLFATTIWIVLQAFDQDVSFLDVIIINEAVALFAGLMPVPGGVGVTEGALTAGFVAVGVPEGIAFSAALCYRMCTFYLPPIWGYVALRSLRRDGYL
jgi:uncharacterized membrane protein YbhN (UPF0104 family)